MTSVTNGLEVTVRAEYHVPADSPMSNKRMANLTLDTKGLHAVRASVAELNRYLPKESDAVVRWLEDIE